LRAALVAMGLFSQSAGCGGSDLCDGLSQACLSVRLEASEADKAAMSDRLRVLVSIDGAAAVERNSTPVTGQPSAFPIAFTVLLGDRGGSVSLDVIAELAGASLLRGQGGETLGAGEHKKTTITLSSPPGADPPMSPSARSGAGFAYFPERHSLVLFGGQDSSRQFLDETWEYSLLSSSWSRHKTAAPPSARTTSLAYHPRRRALVLFGGLGPGGQALGDMWMFGASGTWTPLPLGTGPSPRSEAAIVYDYFRDALELYGGKDGASGLPLSDLWELPAAGSAFLPRIYNPPVPVVSPPRLVFDGRNTFLVGSDETTQSAVKVYRADAAAFTEVAPGFGTMSPLRRVVFSAAFDQKAGAFTLFGGLVQGSPVSETHLFGASDLRWSQVPGSGPSPRSGALVDFVPEKNGIVLLGGTGAGGSLQTDMWVLSGGAWQALP
jgi:hypothetical protein